MKLKSHKNWDNWNINNKNDSKAKVEVIGVIYPQSYFWNKKWQKFQMNRHDCYEQTCILRVFINSTV